MDVATARVVRGFLTLDSNQQQEFIAKVNPVLNGEANRSLAVNESEWIIRVNTGPVGSVCGCCGR